MEHNKPVRKPNVLRLLKNEVEGQPGRAKWPPEMGAVPIPVGSLMKVVGVVHDGGWRIVKLCRHLDGDEAHIWVDDDDIKECFEFVAVSPKAMQKSGLEG